MLNGSGTNDFATSPLGEYHKTRIKREILISNDAHNKIVEAGIGHTKQMVIAGITFASLGKERERERLRCNLTKVPSSKDTNRS